MAKKEGFYFEDTLTGFKWLGNQALVLQSKGYIPMFAFEEAIGFMVGDIVHDKDGISALAVLAEYTNHLYKDKSTLMQFLESIYKK
jgi:phosphomannomutase